MPLEDKIKTIIFTLICGFAFTLPLSITLSQTFAFLSLLLTIYRLRLSTFKDPLLYPILLFFILSAPSFFASPFKMDALYSLKGDTLFFIYFLILKNFESKDIKRITLFLFFGTLASCIYGLLTRSSGERIFEPFGAMTFGHFHSMTFLLFFPFLFFLKGGKRLLLFLSLLLIGVAVFLSGTRGAWISTFFCILLFFLLNKKCFHLLLFLAFFCISLMMSLKYFPSHHLSLRIKSIADLSSWVRLERWAVALCMAKEHPFFGIGIGAYAKKYEEYRRKVLIREEGSTVHAHNSYLHILSERGLAGLFGLLFLLFYILRRSFLSLRYKKGLYRFLCMGATLAIISFCIGALSEHTWADAELFMLFWFCTSFSLCR